MFIFKKTILLKVILLALFSSFLHANEHNDSNEKRLVVVLGMHRSGTSLISKGLQILGVDFGDYLLPASEDNPLGNFEDIDIGSFNETILYLLRLSCDSIKNYPEEIPNKKLLLQYGSNLIRHKTRQKALFGFKDPRTARNMNLWKEIFSNLSGTKVQIVLIVRNPISVAQSLYNRNKIDLVRSYYLWLQYYTSALLGSDDFDTYFISYESLMKNPYAEMKYLGEKLDLKLVGNVEGKLKNFSNKYVNSSMQHHQYSMEYLSKQQEVPIEVIDLYKSLLKTSLEGTNKVELLELARKINHRIIEMGPVLKMVDRIENIGESKKYRFFDLLEELIKLDGNQ